VRLARRAPSLLPAREACVRNYTAVRLGDALRAVGDLAAAGEAYAEAAEIGRSARHAYGRLAGMVMHAGVRAEQGRLREADEAFRQALRLLSERGFELSPAAGVVRIGMADLRYERDDLDEAERELERGVELAERTGDVSTLVWAYVTLSRTKRGRGREGSTREGLPGGARRPRLRRRSADRQRRVLDGAAAPGAGRPRGSCRPRTGACRERGRRRGHRAGGGPDNLGERPPRSRYATTRRWGSWSSRVKPLRRRDECATS
jgi:tetratricopeptide (TPR) repeat protein